MKWVVEDQIDQLYITVLFKWRLAVLWNELSPVLKVVSWGRSNQLIFNHYAFQTQVSYWRECFQWQCSELRKIKSINLQLSYYSNSSLILNRILPMTVLPVEEDQISQSCIYQVTWYTQVWQWRESFQWQFCQLRKTKLINLQLSYYSNSTSITKRILSIAMLSVEEDQINLFSIIILDRTKELTSLNGLSPVLKEVSLGRSNQLTINHHAFQTQVSYWIKSVQW